MNDEEIGLAMLAFAGAAPKPEPKDERAEDVGRRVQASLVAPLAPPQSASLYAGNADALGAIGEALIRSQGYDAPAPTTSTTTDETVALSPEQLARQEEAYERARKREALRQEEQKLTRGLADVAAQLAELRTVDAAKSAVDAAKRLKGKKKKKGKRS